MEKKYQDKHLGDHGFLIYMIPPGILMFGYFIYIIVADIFIVSLAEANNIMFIFFSVLLFSSVIFWLMYEFLGALRIVQEIKIGDNFINMIFYFRKKIKINVNEIKSIMLLKENSYFLKKTSMHSNRQSVFRNKN